MNSEVKKLLEELDIERESLLETVRQFSKQDARMETSLNEFCLSLEKRAEEIRQKMEILKNEA